MKYQNKKYLHSITYLQNVFSEYKYHTGLHKSLIYIYLCISKGFFFNYQVRTIDEFKDI